MSRNKFTEAEKQEAREGGLNFLCGWLDGADAMSEDVPDGAWIQHLKDAVTACNREFGTTYDPNTEVARWLEGHTYAAE